MYVKNKKKKKTKSVKTLVFGCVWTSCSLTLAHSVANKSN